MSKREFINFYIKSSPKRITTHFNQKYFLNDTIKINIVEKTLNDFLKYYTPWHYKNNAIERKINKVLIDPLYKSIKVSEVMNFKEKFGEINKKIRIGLPAKLWPIPIATDIGMKKTIILDGNKTIASIIETSGNLNKKVRVIEIIGKNLSDLVIDFAILAR